jgi:RNase P subunit RPR2
MPDLEGESTYCANCGEMLIARTGFSARITGLKNDICQNCKTVLAGVFN